jgi:hypothetical protein
VGALRTIAAVGGRLRGVVMMVVMVVMVVNNIVGVIESWFAARCFGWYGPRVSGLRRLDGRGNITDKFGWNYRRRCIYFEPRRIARFNRRGITWIFV